MYQVQKITGIRKPLNATYQWSNKQLDETIDNLSTRLAIERKFNTAFNALLDKLKVKDNPKTLTPEAVKEAAHHLIAQTNYKGQNTYLFVDDKAKGVIAFQIRVPRYKFGYIIYLEPVTDQQSGS